MRHDVRQYVAHYDIYQQTKYETHRPTGLLQPLPIPKTIWEDLSLDFITGLPPSQGYTTILVIVDRYSKGTHLGALQPHYIVYKVPLLFIDMVCKHHNFSRSIVFDRDPVFISNLWFEFFLLSGTKLCDVSSIGACRPRIFFINGFLCFLEHEWQRNGE